MIEWLKNLIIYCFVTIKDLFLSFLALVASLIKDFGPVILGVAGILLLVFMLITFLDDGL